jgi:uncharacterized protein (DUF427 family)
MRSLIGDRHHRNGERAVIEATRGRVRVESSEKRVRAYLDGRLVADSSRPVLVWERPQYPTYYFPMEDVRAELVPTSEVERSPSRGDGVVHDVRVPGATAPRAATRYAESPIEELRDLIRLDWDTMSEWFEEDEVVYTHPRDPYTRVDILASSRHLRVEIDGVVVAESQQPRLLFETGLPTRYYVPLTDVRVDLLRPSSSESHCPYKGTPGYFSVETRESIKPDVAWIYRTPLPEAQKIAGLVSFYNERVDIYVDGVLQERPRARNG